MALQRQKQQDGSVPLKVIFTGSWRERATLMHTGYRGSTQPVGIIHHRCQKENQSNASFKRTAVQKEETHWSTDLLLLLLFHAVLLSNTYTPSTS